MLLVGLTGGIASGKSTVARRLAERGAVVIDADVIAREVVAPGTPGHAQVVERFGEEVLAEDGGIDRPALGRVVFADPSARRDLEGIIHPAVREETGRRLAALAEEGAELVVHDVPLLVEAGLTDLYAAIVVVATEPSTQIERLVAERGMDNEDARARIASQAPLEDKLAVATHVIRNDGSMDELIAQVDRVADDLWAQARGS